MDTKLDCGSAGEPVDIQRLCRITGGGEICWCMANGKRKVVLTISE